MGISSPPGAWVPNKCSDPLSRRWVPGGGLPAPRGPGGETQGPLPPSTSWARGDGHRNTGNRWAPSARSNFSFGCEPCLFSRKPPLSRRLAAQTSVLGGKMLIKKHAVRSVFISEGLEVLMTLLPTCEPGISLIWWVWARESEAEARRPSLSRGGRSQQAITCSPAAVRGLFIGE